MPSPMQPFVCERTVEFGDCDPAGIVFYPNFYRWFDHATHCMFRAVGLTHRDFLEEGVLAWPLADTGARFRLPVRAGDHVAVHSRIVEWRERTFKLSHRIMLEGELAVDGWEIRFLGEKLSDQPLRLRTLPIPDSMKRRFDP